jgi:hypothetical protein
LLDVAQRNSREAAFEASLCAWQRAPSRVKRVTRIANRGMFHVLQPLAVQMILSYFEQLGAQPCLICKRATWQVVSYSFFASLRSNALIHGIKDEHRSGKCGYKVKGELAEIVP